VSEEAVGPLRGVHHDIANLFSVRIIYLDDATAICDGHTVSVANTFAKRA